MADETAAPAEELKPEAEAAAAAPAAPEAEAGPPPRGPNNLKNAKKRPVEG